MKNNYWRTKNGLNPMLALKYFFYNAFGAAYAINQSNSISLVLPEITLSSNFETAWLNMRPTIKHFLFHRAKGYLWTCYWSVQNHLWRNWNHKEQNYKEVIIQVYNTFIKGKCGFVVLHYPLPLIIQIRSSVDL
jgi:hypothetical protein